MSEHVQSSTPSGSFGDGPPLVIDEENGNLRAPRILIAFEAPHIIRLLERRLLKAGYQVVQVRDGREALEKVSSEKPEMLLLDTCLPSMDGFQVVECMKADSIAAEIPIMFIHTRGVPEDLLVFRAHGLGVDCFLCAPVNIMEVLTFLRRIFEPWHRRLDKEKFVSK